MNIGKNCTFEEIEVGEVFAYEGCWEIWYKSGEDEAVLVATTDDDTQREYYCGYPVGTVSDYWMEEKCYKLSEEVQQLWKTV